MKMTCGVLKGAAAGLFLLQERILQCPCRINGGPWMFTSWKYKKIVKNITKRKKKMKKSHQKAIKIKFNTLFDKNSLLND